MEKTFDLPATPLPNCGGIVLCGGRSSRMGRSKPHLPWGAGTMLGHIVSQLQRIVQPIVVVAAANQQLPDLPADVIRGEDERVDQGPLEGIRIGLRRLPVETEFAYVTSCDSPLVQVAFITELYQRRQKYEIIVPRDENHYHPLSALYCRGLAERIEQLLNAEQRRLAALFELSSTLEVDVKTLRNADPRLATLQNANTPEDYQRLLGGEW